ncbi:MAG TPA: helix-turn-helix domain-containing protein [Alphaproteobacteria bacterium]|nr:helix-turn-helix domain-containing protein [Alphaproteobacteria bacterium]HQS93850.1 helix-turn-helix domain-containing protein [Alphaproteobacteria bacterium]
MHVFCLFKTAPLSQGFQTYLHKNISPLSLSKGEQEESVSPSSFILLEDPTAQELDDYKDSYGICLHMDTLSTHNREFPHFIFLQKPIYLPALLQIFLERVQKLTLSSNLNLHESLKIGPFLYKKLQRSLFDLSQNKTVSLTEKEAALIDFLSSRPNGGATRGELLENIWKFRDDISTRTLESHIYTLRQKIEPNPNSPQYLLTKEGGYCLNYEAS